MKDDINVRRLTEMKSEYERILRITRDKEEREKIKKQISNLRIATSYNK